MPTSSSEKNVLRLGLPSGSLQEPTLELFKRAGYRIVVEHAIAQLNRFTVLRQVFRGRHRKHKKAHSQVVRVVARLVNRRTRVCPLKKYVPAA